MDPTTPAIRWATAALRGMEALGVRAVRAGPEVGAPAAPAEPSGCSASDLEAASASINVSGGAGGATGGSGFAAGSGGGGRVILGSNTSGTTNTAQPGITGAFFTLPGGPTPQGSNPYTANQAITGSQQAKEITTSYIPGVNQISGTLGLEAGAGLYGLLSQNLSSLMTTLGSNDPLTEAFAMEEALAAVVSEPASNLLPGFGNYEIYLFVNLSGSVSGGPSFTLSNPELGLNFDGSRATSRTWRSTESTRMRIPGSPRPG